MYTAFKSIALGSPILFTQMHLFSPSAHASSLFAASDGQGRTAASVSVADKEANAQPQLRNVIDTLRATDETSAIEARRREELRQTLSDFEKWKLEQADKPPSRSALEHEAALKERLLNMARALARLTGDDSAAAKMTYEQRENLSPGDDTLTVHSNGPVKEVYLGKGNDALNISAEKVTSVDMGSGNDVLTIQADYVSNVGTRSRWNFEPIGQDDDAVAIKSQETYGVSTGGGRDAVAIHAQLVDGVNSGGESDTIDIQAQLIRNISASMGHDLININATLGATRFQYAPFSGGEAAIQRAAQEAVQADLAILDAVDRYSSGLSQANMDVRSQSFATYARAAQAYDPGGVNAGFGNDIVNLQTGGLVRIDLGMGNDTLNVAAGTAYVERGMGHGDDIINAAPGSTLLIDLPSGETQRAWDGNDLVIHLEGPGDTGSTRINGAGFAAGIGLLSDPGTDPEILHIGPAIETSV